MYIGGQGGQTKSHFYKPKLEAFSIWQQGVLSTHEYSLLSNIFLRPTDRVVCVYEVPKVFGFQKWNFFCGPPYRAHNAYRTYPYWSAIMMVIIWNISLSPHILLSHYDGNMTEQSVNEVFNTFINRMIILSLTWTQMLQSYFRGYYTSSSFRISNLIWL